MKNDNEILLRCDCSSAEHQIIVSWDNADNEVYVQVHLANWYGFWRRLWHAIRYVFGYQCRYGAFDEVVLRREDADNLQKVVDHLRKDACCANNNGESFQRMLEINRRLWIA